MQARSRPRVLPAIISSHADALATRYSRQAEEEMARLAGCYMPYRARLAAADFLFMASPKSLVHYRPSDEKAHPNSPHCLRRRSSGPPSSSEAAAPRPAKKEQSTCLTFLLPWHGAASRRRILHVAPLLSLLIPPPRPPPCASELCLHADAALFAARRGARGGCRVLRQPASRGARAHRIRQGDRTADPGRRRPHHPRGRDSCDHGENGSGKSTLTKVLVGHPHYEVTGGTILFKGEDLVDMEPEDRSLAGLFMSFQAPIEIPGVSNFDFLLMAVNAHREKSGLPALGPLEFYSVVSPKIDALKMDPKFLDRNVNEGFSGGERKRNEILQLSVIGADLALLDEIDSGLDVDALEDVANAVNGLLTPQNSVLMITHYQRLLDLIKPSYVHIMENGKIIKTGDSSIATQINEGGFKSIALV